MRAPQIIQHLTALRQTTVGRYSRYCSRSLSMMMTSAIILICIGLFTEHLLKRIMLPNTEVCAMIRQVGTDVKEASNGTQRPVWHADNYCTDLEEAKFPCMNCQCVLLLHCSMHFATSMRDVSQEQFSHRIVAAMLCSIWRLTWMGISVYLAKHPPRRVPLLPRMM